MSPSFGEWSDETTHCPRQQPHHVHSTHSFIVHCDRRTRGRLRDDKGLQPALKRVLSPATLIMKHSASTRHWLQHAFRNAPPQAPPGPQPLVPSPAPGFTGFTGFTASLPPGSRLSPCLAGARTTTAARHESGHAAYRVDRIGCRQTGLLHYVFVLLHFCFQR